MRRGFHVLAVTCICFSTFGLTGCQSTTGGLHSGPCSCGQPHASVQQREPNHIASSRQHPGAQQARPVVQVDHSECTTDRCVHAATNASVAVADTPKATIETAGYSSAKTETVQTASTQPTADEAVCKHCNHRPQIQYVLQPVIVQTQSPATAQHFNPHLQQAMPVVLKQVPQMSPARIHTVASNQPMVDIGGMSHDRYVELASIASGNQPNWTSTH